MIQSLGGLVPAPKVPFCRVLACAGSLGNHESEPPAFPVREVLDQLALSIKKGEEQWH